ncbi:MAG: tRNA dihydrouridine synthase DusB [Wenzhouxiangella sp.]|jgi:tRNA-dihydrouridine synthase B|nr:tRNA dihydrouridine synthase DusB [Wenzhouxiangella sp.]
MSDPIEALFTAATPVLGLAPMAGVTDKPFRRLCKRMGADLAVSEMTTSDASLWKTQKSQWRMNHDGEPEPVSVQIAGTVPANMAAAARHNVALGADIIDINMGCPAKKVCRAWAGSALMRDERLVEQILKAVVNAVEVPVTLKIRTGWDSTHRNALNIARIAEDEGIRVLAIHGRTRDQKYEGLAEYDTIAAVKQALAIPVLANGDIDSPEKARFVLNHTDADGLLIGRAAQGSPWIFREIRHFLQTGDTLRPPSWSEIREVLVEHLHALHDFYGETAGVRIARKHLGWYVRSHPGHRDLRATFNRLDSAPAQIELVTQWFDREATLAALPEVA